MKWIFVIYERIFVVCDQTNLGASSDQVPDKFQTNYGQVSFLFFGQVLDKFRFETCIWAWLDYFFLKRKYSCACILVQNWTNLGASSGQVLDKFRISFIFKLVRELSKNQTCLRVVRVYIGICGFCTRQVRVVQKTNLSASCLPPDNYRTSF